MRDGHGLAADIYLPAGPGPWPVVLIQTPYDKGRFAEFILDPDSVDPLLTNQDYALVVLDWRGHFDSSAAAYEGSPTLGEDGHDAVEWTAGQPWSNGSVGLWGGSALGYVQWATAAEQPPHLRACVPIVSHWRLWYELHYRGGVYCRNRNAVVEFWFNGTNVFRQHPLYDGFWQWLETVSAPVDHINVPMLHVTGWYDHKQDLSIREMHRLQVQGGEGARGLQKLLIGPWTHRFVGRRVQGELEYAAAVHAASQAAVELFDYYLRGVDNNYPSRPTVEYFRMNADQWVASAMWPPSELSAQTFYLTTAESLDPEASDSADAPVEFVADPVDPVPTVFGAVLTEEHGIPGPGDLREIEARADVRTFTTLPMIDPLYIEGRPVAYLWIECDAADTDVAVRLTQVYPDGRSMLLVDGIRRASLRNGVSAREFLDPDTPYLIRVDLPSVAVMIPPEHALRISVSPSNHDRFDVNMQDGTSLSDEDGATPTIATVRVLVDAEHPSRIELPVASVTAVCNADGVCQEDEDCSTCPRDCIGEPPGCDKRHVRAARR